MRLRGSATLVDGSVIAGYAVDLDDLHRRLIVELLIDGRAERAERASIFVDALAAEGTGDACYGFHFAIPPKTDHEAIIELRIANTGEPVGAPLRRPPAAVAAADGLAEWANGLRIVGWLAPNRVLPGVPVRAWVEGRLVAQARPHRARHVEIAGKLLACPAFDLYLPVWCADGRMRKVDVTYDGAPLPGSPVKALAFEDGLANFLKRCPDAESYRAERYDRVFAQSLPFASLDDWRKRFPPAPAPAQPLPVAVVLLGDDHAQVDSTIHSLQTAGAKNWVAGALPLEDGVLTFRSDDLAAFLQTDGADRDVIAFCSSGTQIEPQAIETMAAALGDHHGAAIAYSDVLITSPSRLQPLALPAFDYERLLEQGYGARFFAMRRSAVIDALRTGASDPFRLFNAPCDAGPRADAYIHLPGFRARAPEVDPQRAAPILARATAKHLGARKLQGKVSISANQRLPGIRVRRNIGDPRVSIVIPTRDRIELLNACLHSLHKTVDRHKPQLIIVDNGSRERKSVAFLAELRRHGVTVVDAPGDFNFARLNNLAAEVATGEFLCLLNNDVEAQDDEWLAEMLSRAEEDVGAVGAALLWPSGMVQHGGVVLGVGYGADHAFCERPATDPGYADMLCVAHECSAVTAACLLTRRADYLALGGLDEQRFAVNFNDVDYCLRLRAAGRRVVLTPHARLLHRESASRGAIMPPDRRAQMERELERLRNRWGAVLMADPHYNPALSLDRAPWSALAWPPRDMSARFAVVPPPVEWPPGF